MTIYLTSDLHLGEQKVMVRWQRPWTRIEDHDAALIAGVNERVGEGDTLYILGDFSGIADEARVRAWLDAIVCKNRYLIRGNHDDAQTLFEPGAFVETGYYREISADGHRFCLSHYPMLDWNKGNAYYATHDAGAMAFMLHGHIHSRGRESNLANARAGILRYDVGVDANGYRPVSIGEILAFFTDRG
jgi:calcineurin-like phosphoesterase family protein